ncbi:predicted protein [Histoplasma capsulatum G186AR]|uniref:Uncharacterized protein n=1 Tax=Ajellomyces capsulatus (strain G186AR / H82 / ATCC MYA-2454 / RMSCC 2432) TaxID=447093 RepID=C0NEK9_AJECG|nr:uncharacterized protein HCBG_01325 [Histoplasma capsulatum G186AR]EEH09680.1 predicted protein [Histoplasma capsulatum G186AR]
MTPSAYPAAVGDVSSTKASGSRRWNCHELVSRQHGRFSCRLDPANRCIIQPPMIFFALVNFAPADELDLALKHLEEAKQIIFNSSPVIIFMINPPKPGLQGPVDDRGFHEIHPERISNALTVYNKVSGISEENIVGLFEVIQPRY